MKRRGRERPGGACDGWQRPQGRNRVLEGCQQALPGQSQAMWQAPPTKIWGAFAHLLNLAGPCHCFGQSRVPGGILRSSSPQSCKEACAPLLTVSQRVDGGPAYRQRHSPDLGEVLRGEPPDVRSLTTDPRRTSQLSPANPQSLKNDPLLLT